MSLHVDALEKLDSELLESQRKLESLLENISETFVTEDGRAYAACFANQLISDIPDKSLQDYYISAFNDKGYSISL